MRVLGRSVTFSVHVIFFALSAEPGQSDNESLILIAFMIVRIYELQFVTVFFPIGVLS